MKLFKSIYFSFCHVLFCLGPQVSQVCTAGAWKNRCVTFWSPPAAPNQWPLKLLLFKSPLPAIDVPFILFLAIQFLSLFNFFRHLSFLPSLPLFCQKQSVDFPVDCPALPQSQTWRQVWREGGKQTERGWNAHKKRGQKRRLRALMIRNPFWRSVISVPSGAPQWADSTAELHSITCSRSPVCLSPSFPADSTGCSELRHHFSPPHPALHSHSRGKCASHILTPCTTVQPASRGDLQGAFNYMCMSFATERQDVALNSSSGRQAEETDKEKPKSTQRTELKETRMGKKE